VHKRKFNPETKQRRQTPGAEERRARVTRVPWRFSTPQIRPARPGKILVIS